jgi:integrase
MRRRDASFLLPNDPTRGLELPTEKSPKRPIATDERFEALLKAAPAVHPYMRSLLTLAGETGRRISAVLALRYSDWMPEVGRYGSLRWRADADKLGQEWIAPVTPAVAAELQRLIAERPGVGDALFPATDATRPVDVTLTTRWLRKAEKAAKLPHLSFGGWHMLRRRWATKRKGLPLQDVAALGGWKGTQVLSTVYQQADVETMEAVVLGGRELRAG